jgi:crotonobetainyl-CoA:carnitine CoA-transferase CaiB-like acyl-CoA transferase
MPEQPLSGANIIDLSEGISGACCTKLLADYGAEVIKIERPDVGDRLRRMGPFLKDDPHPEKSGHFLYLNTNKKSITLNLKNKTGRKILKDLARNAEAVVESFPAGRMDAMGIGYETLETINPKLILTSLTNFGQSGPYRDYKANDLILQAMGGWMYQTGDPDREPLKISGNIVGPYVPGLYAAIGTLAAIRWADITGTGQQVDASAMECLLALTRFYETTYEATGFLMTRGGNFNRPIGPASILPCKDGYVTVYAVTDVQWEMMCLMMGIQECLEDERFQTAGGRFEHGEELNAIITPWMVERTKEEIFHTAQEWRVPFGMVCTSEDVLNLPPNLERNAFAEMEHPVAGRLKTIGEPFKMAPGSWRLRSAAPLLGEHNEEIYCGRLGMSKEELVKLREMGII